LFELLLCLAALHRRLWQLRLHTYHIICTPINVGCLMLSSTGACLARPRGLCGGALACLSCDEVKQHHANAQQDENANGVRAKGGALGVGHLERLVQAPIHLV